MGCGSSSLDASDAQQSYEITNSSSSSPDSKLPILHEPDSPQLQINPVLENSEPEIVTQNVEKKNRVEAQELLESRNNISKATYRDIHVRDLFEKSQQGNMISFSAFLSLHIIRQLLQRQIISSDSLLELFQIYDKNEDKRLNRDEFVDLMDIIHLSYGHLLDEDDISESTTSRPSTTTTIDNNNNAAAKVGKRLTYKGPTAGADTPYTPYVPRGHRQEEVGDIDAMGDPSLLDDSTAGRNTAAYPHAVATNLQFDREEDAAGNESRQLPPMDWKRIKLSRAVDEAILATPSNSAASAESRFTSPPFSRPLSVKKGFLVKKEEGDSPSSRGNSKFFTLTDGTLTYYDSASRTPPFSIDRKSIKLSGMNVTVVGDNTLQLHRDLESETVEASAVSPYKGRREILSLEIKSIQERDDWISAIKEHIDYSSGLSQAAAAGPRVKGGELRLMQ